MSYVCLGCRYQNAPPSSCQVSICATDASWSTVWVEQRKYTKNQLCINHPEVCWRCYRCCCCITLAFNVYRREMTGSRPLPHSFVDSTLNEIWILTPYCFLEPNLTLLDETLIPSVPYTLIDCVRVAPYAPPNHLIITCTTWWISSIALWSGRTFQKISA